MAGPHPAVAATRRAVAATLATLRPDEEGLAEARGAAPLVLVACSGGADSTALAAATAFVVARERRRGVAWRAGAVVVDHGLRAGSAAVAQRAAQQCRALGLDPVLVLPVEVTGGGGPEDAARRARYAALGAAADELGAAAVLLGHTLDDQAEGVLLGLARGSGPRALAGMAPRRGLLARPLLALRREQTRTACVAQGLAWWDDPTNGPDAGPLRSAVRGRVMPVLADVLGPGVGEALARTADLLREQADALDQLADELLARAGRDAPDVAVLAAAPAGLRRAALHRALRAAGCPPGSTTRTHVLAVEALVVGWHGQGPVALPGGVTARRVCGRLHLGAAAGPSPRAATTTS